MLIEWSGGGIVLVEWYELVCFNVVFGWYLKFVGGLFDLDCVWDVVVFFGDVWIGLVCYVMLFFVVDDVMYFVDFVEDLFDVVVDCDVFVFCFVLCVFVVGFVCIEGNVMCVVVIDILGL